MSFLNLSWDSSDPTLFLSQKVGLADFVNIAHPSLEELALKQRSQYWIETENKMDTDRKQWPIIPQDYRDITTENLAWQTMTDSFVARAPEASLAPLVSRPELEGMIKEWGYFENIHSRAYSNIIQEVLPNPEVFIQTIVQNLQAFERIAGTVGFFDQLYRAASRWEELDYPTEKDRQEMQYMILLAYIHIYALESIQFYASFACTFALAEEDILSGIANNLVLIARDEALHTRMSKEVITIHSGQVAPWIVEKAMSQAPAILQSVMLKEIEWARYIFRNGRYLPSLGVQSLTEYLYHIGTVSFEYLGVEIPSDMERVVDNPLKYMDLYLDPDRFQATPQETSITNYRVGQTTSASEQDLGGLAEEFGL